MRQYNLKGGGHGNFDADIFVPVDSLGGAQIKTNTFAMTVKVCKILHHNGFFCFAVRRHRLNENGTTVEFAVKVLLLNN